MLLCIAMIQVFCDFDGTITNRDSIVFLTERFGGGPEFRQEILEGIKAGRISVFDAIQKELLTVHVSWDEAVEALRAEIRIDPQFFGFVNWCQEMQYSLSVVSSGMEPVVKLFLGELGIPLFAHPVKVAESGWHYRRDPAKDKKRILSKARSSEESLVVFIGDGTSDVEVIPHADILFAKRGLFLEEYCRQNRIGFFPFESFDDIQVQLKRVVLEAAAGNAVL